MSLPVIEMKKDPTQLSKETQEKYDKEAEQISDEIIYSEMKEITESSEEELILPDETQVEEKEVFLPPKVKEIVKEKAREIVIQNNVDAKFLEKLEDNIDFSLIGLDDDQKRKIEEAKRLQEQTTINLENNLN